MRFLTTLLILATPALLPAQDTGITILPAPYYNDAKQFLGLSDPQMQSLTTIVKNKDQAQQAHWQQIAEKNQQLYQLLEAGTGSATQIGQLLIDIRNMEKQTPTLEAPYRQQAANVLTADQKTKLVKLDEALKLQNTASQAAMLLLLEYPRIGLPMPLDSTSSTSSGAGIGIPFPAGRISAVAPANRRP